MTTRRTFLRGAGAAIALPFLPSLLPRVARAQEAQPVRLVFFYVPNGVRLDHWRPDGEGDTFTLNQTMSSLAGLREHISVITGLRNDGGRGDRPGDHARGTGAFLTCVQPDYDGVHVGQSVDQLAAQALGDATTFRSLELGVQGGGSFGTCDSGYSCAYTQNVSWANATTPMPKLTNPRLVFDRLFAGGDQGIDAEARLRRATYRTSVLDEVMEQVGSLESTVGRSDKHRLDQYLTGLREVERRVQGLGGCGTDTAVPDEVLLEQHPDIMMDLVVPALACDLTRFVTFMMGNAGSNHVYNFLDGVRGAHHEVSHHQNLDSNLDQISAIDHWQVERFARFVGKLRDATVGEAGESLLENTIVMFSSEISDGNRHNHDDLPVILAGQGGGAIKTGTHLVVDDVPIANLYTSMLGAVGINQTFADATGPLAGLAG